MAAVPLAAPLPAGHQEQQKRALLATLRFMAWVICVVVCVINYGNFCAALHGHWDTRADTYVSPSAIQEAGAAASALVEMFFAFVVARAFDACTRR